MRCVTTLMILASAFFLFADVTIQNPTWVANFVNDDSTIVSRPSPKEWVYETGFVRNRELQWYQPENVWCRNGKLIIEARRERKRNPGYDPNVSAKPEGPAAKPKEDWKRSREFAEYTSGSVKTKGLVTWRYGSLHVSARFRPEQGLWPAIWFVGEEGEWPTKGEVDLLEFYQGALHANAAWGVGTGTWNAKSTPLGKFIEKDPLWGEKFHNYTMDWSPTLINLKVDGEILNSIDITKTLNPDGTNPFHKPFHIIINLAVGSTGGDPAKTKFPAQFEVGTLAIWGDVTLRQNRLAILAQDLFRGTR